MDLPWEYRPRNPSGFHSIYVPLKMWLFSQTLGYNEYGVLLVVFLKLNIVISKC